MNQKFIEASCLEVENDEEVIEIKIELLLRLQKLGHMFSTYSEVIDKLLSHCDECDRFVENRT